MNEPISFTDREMHVLSYFRDRTSSSPAKAVLHTGIYVILSLAAVGWFLLNGGPAWGFVGYGILLWRAIWELWQSVHYAEDYRRIFEKYEARVRELADRVRDLETGPESTAPSPGPSK